jgi:SCY1-like protein 2
MFSYGMLFYAAYNNGKTLYKCNENYSSFVNNVEEVKLRFFVTLSFIEIFKFSFIFKLKKLTNSRFNSIPTDVREYLKMLLHINSELRPDASQVMKVILKKNDFYR